MAKSEGLILPRNLFLLLVENIISRFKKKHGITKKVNDSQLYGFGNYSTNEPNLKNDFELILKEYVNGKYLYNKFREASIGTPLIKINKEYRFVYFKYLGYNDLNDFLIENNITQDELKKNTLSLNITQTYSKDYFYVSYYFGEDNKMYKGKVIITNDWRNVEMIYVYLQESTFEKGTYTFNGPISHSDNFVHFNTKYFDGSRKKEGAKFIFFVGKSFPEERSFLVGTYSGYDKFDRAIAGKMILKRYLTKEEVDTEINSPVFDPLICLEINKVRIVVESNIRQNPLLFSKVSPFAISLENTHGKYLCRFEINNLESQLRIEIQEYHHNIISLDSNVIIEEDKINILNQGQILFLDFSLLGITTLSKVSIYLNILNIENQNKKFEGFYSGITNKNNLVSGKVILEKMV